MQWHTVNFLQAERGFLVPRIWVEARITQALPYDLVAQVEKILP